MPQNITSEVVSLGIHKLDSDFAEEKIALHRDLFTDVLSLSAPPPSPFISVGATPTHTTKLDTPIPDHLNKPTIGIVQSPTHSLPSLNLVPRSAPVTPKAKLNPPIDPLSPPRSLHNPNLFPHGPRGNREEFLVRITVWDVKDRTTFPDLSGVASKLNRHLRDQKQDNFHYNRPPTHRSLASDASPLDLSLPAISSTTSVSACSSPTKFKSSWLQPKREPSSGNRNDSDVSGKPINQIQHPSLPTSPSDVDDEVHVRLMKTHTKRLTFVMAAGAKCFSHLKTSSNVKVSLLKPIADLYGLSSRDTVTVTKIDRANEEVEMKAARADHIIVTIKDQFISRGGMYQFQGSFLRKWIYTGERLSTVDKMHGNVMDLKHGDKNFKSAFVGPETKITFRCRSARIIWLVNLTSEMWDFAPPYTSNKGSDQHCCGLYFHNFISFAYELFEEWNQLEVSHSLTVIYFSRTYVTKNDAEETEDHFKVVIENQTRKDKDWNDIVLELKKAFISYPMEVGWNSHRFPSTAEYGNILEAINTALNMLQLHYMDRDLKRSGNSIVLVSAGSGRFVVDKGIAEITEQRMMDNGIGSDVLSLGLPPLHVAPFFIYTDESKSKDLQSHISADSNDFDAWKTHFEVPHWMHLSFAAYDNTEDVKKEDVNSDDIRLLNKSNGPGFSIAANGAVIWDQKFSIQAAYSLRKAKPTSKNRHLITGREFEDILEACQPKSTGRKHKNIPFALLSQLRQQGEVKEKDDKEDESSQCEKPDFKDLTPNLLQSSVLKAPRKTLRVSHLKENDGSGSERSSSRSTTPVSSYNNLFSLSSRSPTYNIYGTSPSSKVDQIQQQHVQLITCKKDRCGSYDSISSIGTHENSNVRNKSVFDDLFDKMSLYDDNLKFEDEKKLQTTRKPDSVDYIPRYSSAHNEDLHNNSPPAHEEIGMLGSLMASAMGKKKEGHKGRKERTPVNQIEMQDQGRSNHAIQSRKWNLTGPHARSSNKGAKDLTRGKLKKKYLYSVRPVNESIKVKARQVAGPSKSRKSRRPMKLNPFSQEDEEEVLSQWSHNTRRWSHVFPPGEVEFKRRAGPNWQSLCQPAILPVTIDYYPITGLDFKSTPPNAISPSDSGTDTTFSYASSLDLLVEMVKQRLIQDYQLVSEKAVSTELQRGGTKYGVHNDSFLAKNKFKQTRRPPMKINVSMGHRTQELSLHNGIIKVERFSKHAENDQEHQYTYMLWLPSTKSYDRVTIKFKKFAEEYGWNNLDLLLHSENMVLRENHRYRRISYRVIPTDYKIPGRSDEKLEKTYTEKMEKLIAYLSKYLIKKDVKVTFKTRSDAYSDEENSQWYKVPIDRKKTLNLEWMQICIDTAYYTDKTFGLVFGWLVASAHHIETIINLVQRRCLEYGLDFICVPQTSLNSNMYLNPFLRPEIVEIKGPNKDVCFEIERSLYEEHDFVNDGVRTVKKEDIEGRLNDKPEIFGFDNGKSKVHAQQYMHLSGIMFIRLLKKKNGGATYLFLENRKLQTSKCNDKIPDGEVIFRKVKHCILKKSLKKSVV